MGIDPGGLEVGMTEKLLYRADVVAFFQKMGGKAVAQRMDRGIGYAIQHAGYTGL